MVHSCCICRACKLAHIAKCGPLFLATWKTLASAAATAVVAATSTTPAAAATAKLPGGDIGCALRGAAAATIAATAAVVRSLNFSYVLGH